MSDTRRTVQRHPIAPVWDETSRILILGSFPSVKSREANFFYGHPQNRFWRVLAAVLGCDKPESTEEKKRFLLGLAKEQKGIEGVQNDSAEEPSLCRRSAKTAADRLGRSRQSHSRICRHSSVSLSKPHAAFAGLVEGSGTAGRPIFGSICLT